eukprot:474461_1
MSSQDSDDEDENTTIFVTICINKEYELKQNINTTQDVSKLVAQIDQNEIDLNSLKQDIPHAFRQAKWIKPLFINKQYTWKIFSYQTQNAITAIETDHDLQVEVNKLNDTNHMKFRIVFEHNNAQTETATGTEIPIRIYLNKDFNIINDFNKKNDVWIDIKLERDYDSEKYELEDLMVDIKSKFKKHKELKTTDIKNRLRDQSLYNIIFLGYELNTQIDDDEDLTQEIEIVFPPSDSDSDSDNN